VDQHLPDVIADVTARHLELLDLALPGRTQGLYVTGSAALGDFRPPMSDIDAVVVLDDPVEDPAALEAVHAQLPGDPAYDVFYLTRAQLAAPPVEGTQAPFTMHGLFDDGFGGAPVSPVLWAELARQPLVVRAAPDLVVHDDHDGLRRHTRANLDDYWRPWLDDAADHLAAGKVTQAEAELVSVWPVLGVPRLHALLATDRIISKSQAAEYAAEHFAAHADLARRCLAHRHGVRQTWDLDHAAAAVTLGRDVIADAHRRWP
jgi:hypothetical protein